jgi:hypothetical protein
MTKIEHAAGWANGWTKTGRRKLARFERLAKKGVRMRTLKRALVPHEVCLHVMAERARIATPKKGKPLERIATPKKGKPLELWPPLGMQKKPRYTADARARMSLAKSYYVEDSA